MRENEFHLTESLDLFVEDFTLVGLEVTARVISQCFGICDRVDTLTGLLVTGEEALAWIPGRLFVQACMDRHFQAFLFNGPLRDGLLPPKTSDAAAARHWVAVYQVAAPFSFCLPGQTVM